MKGLIFEEKGKVAVKDVSRPECMPDCVIIEVEAAGICGSDLHMYAGHWGKQPEQVVGHEFSGKVIEVGEGVEGIAAGDRICSECFRHCGTCLQCQTGLYNLCTNREFTSGGKITGAFAEYARIPATSAFKMPEGATVDQTALVEPVAVAARAVSQSGAKPGDCAVVIGGGTIGLLSAAALKARMRVQCMVVVKYDQQAEIARKLGIDHVHNITQGKTVDAVKELTGGSMADVVIETIGSTIAVADAVAIVRVGGSVCHVALPGGRTMMPMGPIVGKELHVVGSCCYGYSNGRKDFDSDIDLITSGALPAERIITHRFPLDQAAEAFEIAADKKSGSVKVLFEM